MSWNHIDATLLAQVFQGYSFPGFIMVCDFLYIIKVKISYNFLSLISRRRIWYILHSKCRNFHVIVILIRIHLYWSSSVYKIISLSSLVISAVVSSSYHRCFPVCTWVALIVHLKMLSQDLLYSVNVHTMWAKRSMYVQYF